MLGRCLEAEALAAERRPPSAKVQLSPAHADSTKMSEMGANVSADPSDNSSVVRKPFDGSQTNSSGKTGVRDGDTIRFIRNLLLSCVLVYLEGPSPRNNLPR